jgi:hypothetical protein
VKLIAILLGSSLNTNSRRRITVLMMTHNQNSNSNLRFLSLGPNLKIFHINEEGVCISKSEYLAFLMLEEKVDIIAVQETHTESEENLRSRGARFCIYWGDLQ